MSREGNYKPNYNPTSVIFYYKHFAGNNPKPYNKLSKEDISKIESCLAYKIFKFKFELMVLLSTLSDVISNLINKKTDNI